jgi:uncharacterized C2H2 Zn-finger protein
MCGMEFTNVDEYATHVSKCAEQYKIKESKKKEEELKKAKEVNEYVENIKRYKTQLKTIKDEFIKKYPNEYDMNFPNELKCDDNESKEKDSFYGSVNGKEVDNMEEFLKELREECGFLW